MTFCVDRGEIGSDIDAHIQFIRSNQPSLQQVLKQRHAGVRKTGVGSRAIDHQASPYLLCFACPILQVHADAITVCFQPGDATSHDAQASFCNRFRDALVNRLGDAVSNHVPAGSIPFEELLLFRKVKFLPDLLGMRSQSIHDNTRVFTNPL